MEENKEYDPEKEDAKKIVALLEGKNYDYARRVLMIAMNRVEDQAIIQPYENVSIISRNPVSNLDADKSKMELALSQIEGMIRDKNLNEENSAYIFNRIALIKLLLARKSKSQNDH